jgi:type IV secretion system protein VirB2
MQSPVRLALAATVAAATFEAQAQVTRVNSVMSNFQSMLVGVSVTIVTIAIMWAGYKMLFQHHKWSEISNIVIGAIVIGGAPGLASWLMA